LSQRNSLMKSNWCKSSLARAVAGGPIASVAIRRVTGGCRSVHSEKAGREESAPITVLVAMPTLLVWRKAASGCTVMRGVSGIAGVPSPGHAFKEISREPRRAHDLCRTTGVWFTPRRTNPAPEVARISSERSEQILDVAVSRCQGRPEVTGMDRRAVLEPHSTCEGGELQGSREGRPGYPLEGRGNQADVSKQKRIAKTPNLEFLCPRIWIE
jgi:hypothetical protein